MSVYTAHQQIPTGFFWWVVGDCFSLFDGHLARNRMSHVDVCFYHVLETNKTVNVVVTGDFCPAANELIIDREVKLIVMALQKCLYHRQLLVWMAIWWEWITTEREAWLLQSNFANRKLISLKQIKRFARFTRCQKFHGCYHSIKKSDSLAIQSNWQGDPIKFISKFNQVDFASHWSQLLIEPGNGLITIIIIIITIIIKKEVVQLEILNWK